MGIASKAEAVALVAVLVGWGLPPPAHGVIRHGDGRVEEGPYVDGERHGHWVFRWPDGQV